MCEYKYVQTEQSRAQERGLCPGHSGEHKCHCARASRAVLCVAAPCGGTVHNATIGRVLSPSYSGNQSGSMYCVWAIGAPPGQKLHLHFEKLLLTEKDR